MSKTTRGMDNKSFIKGARRGTIYEENGLYGLKDTDGTVLFPPEFMFIGRCRDYVMVLEPDGSYCKITDSGTEEGYLDEKDRPWVEDGKVGFKRDGKVIIPAEYEFLEMTFGDDTVFTVVKDGREFYINNENKEVLSRVRWFDGEARSNSPFWLRFGEFDHITARDYIGHRDDNNPNVIQLGGEWVELERYCKDEIMKMLIDPSDDLAITEKGTAHLCNDFSYEYSFYFANAAGESPLSKCMDQLEKMRVFCNTWHYVIKVWQAPGEHVEADDIRRFNERLQKTEVLGTPLYAFGHSESLKPGEVRMLFITYYNERCWPAGFEFDWSDKCESLPITELRRQIPELKKTIREEIEDKYRDEVFQDQICQCITDLRYYDTLGWEETESALEYFLSQGSGIKSSLKNYIDIATKCLTGKNQNTAKGVFFVKASQWALKKGSEVNLKVKGNSCILDCVDKILGENFEGEVHELTASLREDLISKGALTFASIDSKHKANNDYYKELEYLNK